MIRLLEPVSNLRQGERIELVQTDLAQNEHLQRIPKLIVVLNDAQPSVAEAPDQDADLLLLQVQEGLVLSVGVSDHLPQR